MKRDVLRKLSPSVSIPSATLVGGTWQIVTKVVIRTDDAGGLFARAKDAARRADRAHAFGGAVTLIFENTQRKFSMLSGARCRFVLEVMLDPKSISELPNRLRRNRSAITKDVGLLEKFCLLVSQRQVNPGYGIQKWCFRSPRRSRWWRYWGNRWNRLTIAARREFESHRLRQICQCPQAPWRHVSPVPRRPSNLAFRTGGPGAVASGFRRCPDKRHQAAGRRAALNFRRSGCNPG